MKAFVIAAETVTDGALFDAYRTKVPTTVAASDGRYVVRGGDLTTVEGERPHPRLVVREFPCRAAAEGWYGSADDQAVIALRREEARGSLVIVDGAA